MIGTIIGIILLVLLILYIYWRFFFFFRDPNRRIPKGKCVVSPADGTIVYVKKVHRSKIPICNKKGRKISLKEDIHHTDKGDKLFVGIFMTPFNVHVQRCPVDGKVEYVKHYKHKDLPMTLMWLKVILGLRPFYKGSMHMWENERNVVRIKGKINAYVVQIADIAVNRVVCSLKKEQKVSKGQRLGLIKFGSQVDLVLPYNKVVAHVKEGDKVKAGSSIIATIK